MSDLFSILKQKVAGKKVTLVFPEGLDERILTAVSRLASEQVLNPIVIGNKEAVKQKAAELGVELSNVQIIDPQQYEEMDELVAAFVERRKGKVSSEEARNLSLIHI